ncbi:MAG: hypothetical protein LUC98_14655 [Lachnospiraceae bacterium]|nr:hypothetical protein [Lachnospiraceae bacterium]
MSKKNGAERRRRRVPFRHKNYEHDFPLQTPHVWNRQNSEYRKKAGRVSFCASGQGSLTLEATLTLPFLLCAVTALLYLFAFSAANAVDYRALVEKAETLAVTAGQQMTDDPYIDLYDYDTAKAPFSALSFGSRSVLRHVTVRAWVGYTGESFEAGGGEQIVYKTPDGEVYHLSCDCSYLALSVRSLAYSALPGERNSSGSRYTACEYCVGNGSANALVYITDYGDCYHNSRSCRGLKRTVMGVPLSEVSGLRPCSRCGSQ